MQIDVPKIKLQWGIIEFLIDAFVHDAIANNQRGDLQVGFKNIHPNARVEKIFEVDNYNRFWLKIYFILFGPYQLSNL